MPTVTTDVKVEILHRMLMTLDTGSANVKMENDTFHFEYADHSVRIMKTNIGSFVMGLFRNGEELFIKSSESPEINEKLAKVYEFLEITNRDKAISFHFLSGLL